MYLPIKISSKTGKQVEIIEALLDSGASGKFIDQDYAQKIHAERKNLERPIQVYNMDGTPNKKGQSPNTSNWNSKYTNEKGNIGF